MTVTIFRPVLCPFVYAVNERSNKNDKVDTSTIFYPQEGAQLIQGQGS